MTQLPTMGKQPVTPKSKKQPAVPDLPTHDQSAAAAEVSELELEYDHYFSMADQMLRKIVTENRLPRFEELTFFRGRCGWDESEIRRQINRMIGVVRGQSIAGSHADREAALDEMKLSKEILETRKPIIEKEIAALQERLGSIERNATRAQRRCEEIDTAVADLKRLLRPDLLAKYNAHLLSIVGEFERIGELNTEISHREVCLGSVPNEGNARQRFCEMVRMSFPDCVERSEHYAGRLVFAEPAWTSQKATMRDELESLRSELEQLQQRKSERLQSIAPILNFYLMESK